MIFFFLSEEIMQSWWLKLKKKIDVWFPYKHVIAFWIRAQTKYILPTELKPILRLLLKSKALNDLTTSPNVHSTDSLTELIDKL